mgnify:FL=1
MAGGAQLYCTQVVKQCSWQCKQAEFKTDFRLLQLGHYDGILGLDWLASHSPMVIDWEQKWFSFQYQGSWITLQGELPKDCTYTVMSAELDSADSSEDSTHIPEVQALLKKFSAVFEEPKGLPPRRQYDHTIILIPGATPVAVRPYRVAPHLKTEMEGAI